MSDLSEFANVGIPEGHVEYDPRCQHDRLEGVPTFTDSDGRCMVCSGTVALHMMAVEIRTLHSIIDEREAERDSWRARAEALRDKVDAFVNRLVDPNEPSSFARSYQEAFALRELGAALAAFDAQGGDDD